MNFEIPKELSHLKVDPRGYTIPFFVPIVDGVPNFKLADGKKQNIAIDQHLCHICGKKLLKNTFFFISGPLGLQNQVCTDAAMHRVCAEFALKACPHMFFQKAERKVENTGPSPLAPGKPETIYLIKSDKYKAKFHPEFGYRLIHFRVTGSEKYIYVDNKLQKA